MYVYEKFGLACLSIELNGIQSKFGLKFHVVLYRIFYPNLLFFFLNFCSLIFRKSMTMN